MEKPKIKQLGNYVVSKRKNSSNGRVYDPTGIAPTLCTCIGGGADSTEYNCRHKAKR